MMKEKLPASEFLNLGIEYFFFEEDFIKENVRCIPMIVRFKMDLAGIKLKLAEWSRFSIEERKELATRNSNSREEVADYKKYLSGLVTKYTGRTATDLQIEDNPLWAATTEVPVMIQEKAVEFNWSLSVEQWNGLTNLQRFALLKLCRPGHENKNFPLAMKEFGVINN